MLNSTARSITADEIVLLFSDVKKIEVGVTLTQLVRSKSGVDSSASFIAGVEGVSVQTVLDKQGYADFVPRKGEIIDPQLTAGGKPRLGIINQAT